MSWLVTGAMAVLAGFIQTVTGFGAAAVLMTVLPGQSNLLTAAAVTQIVCLGLTSVLIVRLRRHIRWRKIWLPTTLYTVFCLAAVQVAGGLELRGLTIAFGVFFVLLAVWFMAFHDKVSIRGSLTAEIACSAASGAMGGLFGVGGPPMALYMVSVMEERESYLAGLQVLFWVSGVFSAGSRILNGMLPASRWTDCAAGVVGIWLGGWLGMKLGKRLPADKMKMAVYAFVGVSGILTVVGQL